jgi:hypothetical protein
MVESALKRERKMAKSDNKRRTKFVQLDLDEYEKQAFLMAAELAGVALGSWARERLRSAARRELIEFGQKVPFLPNLD